MFVIVMSMFTALVEDLMGLDDLALTDRFRDLELQRRRLDAELAAVVAVADNRGTYRGDGHLNVQGWLRANGNWSGAEVTAFRKKAALLDACPSVGDAMLHGHIGVAQAAELARARGNKRCGPQIVDVLEVLLDSAEHLPFDNFRTVVRRWENLADQDGAHHDAEVTHANRTVSLHELNGGIDLRASGGDVLSTAEMLGVFDRFVEAEFQIDVAARTELHGPDAPASLLPRTDAQRRFDALVKIFRTAAAMPADARRPEPVVNIVCDLHTWETLLARHRLIPFPDDLPLTHLADRRCETDTGVPVPTEAVLQAALLGHVRRVIVDRDGVVIDMGRRRRLFTGSARVAATLMATTCSRWGCTIGSANSQVDHLREWSRHGGPTDQTNADVDCSSHNRHKHRSGSTAKRDPAGHVIHYRADGTPMTPVGYRPIPEPEPDPWVLFRQGLGPDPYADLPQPRLPQPRLPESGTGQP